MTIAKQVHKHAVQREGLWQVNWGFNTMLAMPVLVSKRYEANIAVATQSTVGGGD